MKSRIGTINKKPIAQGDKNLVTPNEIHVSELKGGGQGNVPVEYYKVVAPGGSDLEVARDNVFSIISTYLTNLAPNLYILVKGTSSPNTRFTGFPILPVLNLPNKIIYAYEIKSLNTITKSIDNDGAFKEFSNFNNIFDAFDSIMNPNMSLQLKQMLVPITAEEFHNLDDIE